MSQRRPVTSKSARGSQCVVVYEDISEVWLDRLVFWIHDRKWRNRTGPCTFRLAAEWRALFTSAGFEIVEERQLSRWRNFTHPVCRSFYLLTPNGSN